jgi:hypothetical protein
MQQWEYLELRVHTSWDNWSDSLGRSGPLSTVTGPHRGTAAVCNELGEQGWELVGLTSDDRPNQNFVAIFKRPKLSRQDDRAVLDEADTAHWLTLREAT